MIEKGVIKQNGKSFESFSSGILLGQPATPNDLSGLTSFLASDDADDPTGQIFLCDGGMVLVRARRMKPSAAPLTLDRAFVLCENGTGRGPADHSQG